MRPMNQSELKGETCDRGRYQAREKHKPEESAAKHETPAKLCQTQVNVRRPSFNFVSRLV